MVKKSRLYNLQILQTDIWGKVCKKKGKAKKTHVLLENNQAVRMSGQKKKKHLQNYQSLNVINCSIFEIELILRK